MYIEEIVHNIDILYKDFRKYKYKEFDPEDSIINKIMSNRGFSIK